MKGGLLVFFKKELRGNMVKGMVCLTIAVVTAGSLPYSFSMLGNLPLTQEMLPSWLHETLQVQMSNYTIFAWSNWYGKNLMQYLLLFALLFGAPAVAAEASNRSISFTLAQSVSRENVMAAKLLAGLVWLVSIALLSTLVLTGVSRMLGYDLSWDFAFRGLPGTLAGTMLAYSLALLFSVFGNDTVKSGVIAAGCLVLLAVPGFIPAVQKFSFITYMAAGGPGTVPGWYWKGTLAVVLASIFCYWFSWRSFEKRDF